MGYLFLIGCIVFVALMIYRSRKGKKPVTEAPPRSFTINFEKMEPLIFWTFVPLVFGIAFYTCVFTPIKGCQDKLTQESEEAIQRMHARQMESSRQYHEYQRRAYPNPKKRKTSVSHRSKDPFYNLAAVDPPP